MPAWAEPVDTGPKSNARAEDIGIVTGLAVGAAAGGPVGALIGAAAGGLMGDHYHKQREKARALSADLDKSEAERARLTASVTELNGSLAQSQAQGEQLEHTLTDRAAGFVDRPAAGSFLTDEVFAPGATMRWDRLVEAATGEPLTAAHLAAQLAA